MPALRTIWADAMVLLCCCPTKCSHGRYVNEWVWLCSLLTIYQPVKLDLAWGSSQPDPWLCLLFDYLLL